MRRQTGRRRSIALVVAIAFGLMHEVTGSAQGLLPGFLSRVTPSAFVETYFADNFNTPETPCTIVNGVAVFNCLHALDVARSAFRLDLASIGIDKKPTADSRAGFSLDLMFGTGAAVLADLGGSVPLQNVLEAYASYLAVERAHLRMDFGKFTTPAGFEKVEPAENWNASRSLLFALAIPHEHVGFRLDYEPTSRLSVTGFLAKGWSDVTENAGAKEVGVSASVRLVPHLTIQETYIGGPETTTLAGLETTTSISSGWRDVWDTVAAARFGWLDLGANLDIGNDRNTLQSWQGIAAYVRPRIGTRSAIGLRVEQLWDHDGFMTGTAQDVQEATATAEYRRPSWLVTRLEYRIDVTDRPYFLQGVSTTVRTQQIALASWVLQFGAIRNRPLLP